MGRFVGIWLTPQKSRYTQATYFCLPDCPVGRRRLHPQLREEASQWPAKSVLSSACVSAVVSMKKGRFPSPTSHRSQWTHNWLSAVWEMRLWLVEGPDVHRPPSN